MILSIIILSYNTRSLTVACVKSLISVFERELKNEEIEIIVVDNASSDDSTTALKDLVHDAKGIRLIESKKNLGFGGGNNLGTEASRGSQILFLNSDTEVQDRGFLKMAKFLEENPGIGVLGAKLINPDGSSQRSVGKFYNVFNSFIMMVGLERLGILRSSPKALKRVDWVAGAVMMVNKKMFKEIGMFDPNIFIYMEDLELCFRAKKKGYDTYFFPDTVVMHKERGSSNRSFAVINIVKNLLYFYDKHKPRWQYLIIKYLILTKAWTILLLGKITGNSYYVNTYKEVIKALG